MHSVHFSVAEAVNEVNSSLNTDDSCVLLQALHNKYAGLTNVQESNALHYLTVLRAMRVAKVEVNDKLHVCLCVDIHVHVYTYTYIYVYT